MSSGRDFEKANKGLLNAKNRASVSIRSEPVIEAVSLDMKQQELDNR